MNCSNTPGGAEDWAPSWSPDGTRLAVAIDTGDTDLVLFRVEINAQGDPTCTFVSNLTGDGTPFGHLYIVALGGVDWSKDPSQPDQIAAVAEDLNGVRDIWVVYPDDPASFRNVTNGCCRPWSVSWSPDNSQLLFLDSANGTLRTIRADGTGLRTFPLSGKFLPHDWPWYGGAA